MQVAYYLENVDKLIASRQQNDLIETKSKGISWVCDIREVHSDAAGLDTSEPKLQIQGPGTMTSG